MKRPTLRQITLYGFIHLIVTGLLWMGASFVGLNFERTPSLFEEVLFALGIVFAYPILEVFEPLFLAFLPPEPAVLLAALVNSVLWGLGLALAVNAVRGRRHATPSSP